jgi:transposase
MTVTDAITPLLTARIPHLKLEQLDRNDNQLHAVITSQQPTSNCPACGTPSAMLHSHYKRTVQDLPVGGSNTTWTLHVRRFRCRKQSCQQRVFCERFNQGLNAYARSTSRVNMLFEKTSLSIGASPASSLNPDFNLKASNSTMLRRAHQAATPNTMASLKVIGVDDFAFQKGRMYGTIIVDHEQGKVVDLLPDRTSKTLTTWLKAHPEIEIITRDRSHEYAKASTDGAPQARQVLDRWHLLKNLRDALENFLARHRKPIAEIAKEFKDASILPASFRESKKQRIKAKAKLRARQERIQRARELFAKYKSITRVAQELPASITFVYKAIRTDDLPELRNNARGGSLLDRWVPELELRFARGLRNGRQFWRELREIGFEGSYERIRDWVRFRRDQHKAQDAAQQVAATEGTVPPETVRPGMMPQIPVVSENSRLRSFAPRQLVWLLLFADEKLNDQDAKILERLSAVCPDVPKARTLALEFQRLMREKDVKALDAWFTAVKASFLSDMTSFVVSLERERKPLEAAITEVWSNGRVEGQVNRLKLIKRQGFGRAGFELLRKRVLAA